MQELIEVIRAAVTTGATNEQKAAGVQACRTIIAALDTEPGNLLVPPSLLATSLATRPTLDQMLDLAIARLSTIALAEVESMDDRGWVEGIADQDRFLAELSGEAIRDAFDEWS